MQKYLLFIASLIGLGFTTMTYMDGVLVRTSDNYISAERLPIRQFNVIDSFPAAASGYSMGLACDGKYLWNNETFIYWFARMDTVNGSIINTFTPVLGNRDMTFDGQYLWASDWQTGSINKYDTSNCSVIATYYPQFSAGKPNGMAWDGAYLWVGEESGNIYKMTTTGDIVRSIPPPVYYSYEPRGLAFDGQYLWVGYQSSGLIYKVDTTNGAVLEVYSAPGAVPGWRFQQGLDCDGYFLWSTVGGSVQMIYQIDIGLPGAEEHKNKIAPQPRVKLIVNPNPFVKSTNISFILKSGANVRLSIVDAGGRAIATLIERKFLQPGSYEYTWQSTPIQSGIYFILLETDDRITLRKIVRLQLGRE
ncbi:MAG: T9SS type A sorting domain-containing protein [candidate division WOR-3 bacterium]